MIGDGYGNHGRAKRVIYRYKNYTMQEQLTWRKKINSLHTFDALAAHENYYYNYGYLYGYKTTETFAGGTELINFTNITSLDGYQNNYRTESYLSRLRYNYDEKYFAEASFRRDGSSRFAPGKRWGNFWSVGGSWVVTEEDFLKPYAETINNLKFRASYGEVGNDASVDYYGYMALYDLNQNANITAAYKVQNEALDIQWETASSLGVALEGRLFKRANFSLEYFDKRSQDLLFDVQLPLSVGANSTSSAEATVTKNLGSVSNRGIEISADVDVIKSKGLTWNIGANV
ncbi:TonB-dependent receptor SusC, partial [termite gut metagenome]